MNHLVAASVFTRLNRFELGTTVQIGHSATVSEYTRVSHDPRVCLQTFVVARVSGSCRGEARRVH